jgi:hypothetical protein
VITLINLLIVVSRIRCRSVLSVLDDSIHGIVKPENEKNAWGERGCAFATLGRWAESPIDIGA